MCKAVLKKVGLWFLLCTLLLVSCGSRPEVPAVGTNGKSESPSQTETDTQPGEMTESTETTNETQTTGEHKPEEPTTDEGKQEELPKVDIEKSTAARKYFVGTTDKDAIAYGLGEEMHFTVSLYADEALASCAKFQYILKADDGREVETGYADGKTGVFTLTTKLDVPGFVNLQVIACNQSGQAIGGVDYFKGGAGADIGNIKKAVAEPADFDAFWKSEVAKLDGTAPDLLEAREVTSPDSAFTVYAIKIRFCAQNIWGNYVSGYLSVPKNAKKEALALNVVYMGAGIFDVEKVCTKRSATLVVSAHSIELGRDSSYYGGLMNGRLKDYMNYAGSATRGVVYFREMLLRDVQALRFMKQYFGESGADERFAGLWNTKKGVILSGGSQGGFQAVAVAALEPADIPQININYPWMCDVGGCGANGRMASTFMPNYTPALEYYDTVNFGKRLKCTVVLSQEGLGDDIATTTGVTIFWNNLPADITRMITYLQNQSHSHFPKGRTDRYTLRETAENN